MDRPPTEPDNYCVSGEALTNFEGAYFQPKACFTGAVHTGSSHDTTLHKFANKAIGKNGQQVEKYAKNCKAPPSSEEPTTPAE